MTQLAGRALVSRGTSSDARYLEVLDRVLDKGVVVDAWVRVSLVGIELLTVDAQVVVASIATYLERADDLTAANTRPAPPAPSLADLNGRLL